MNARADYPVLASRMGVCVCSPTARKALDEIDTLRAALDAQVAIGADLACVAFQDEIDRLRGQVAAVNAALDLFYEEWPVEPPKFVKAVAEAVGR